MIETGARASAEPGIETRVRWNKGEQEQELGQKLEQEGNKSRRSSSSRSRETSRNRSRGGV
jgi:hypothetical protein